MDNIEILQVKHLISMYKSAFADSNQPTGGNWQHAGTILKNHEGVQIAKFAKSMDCGYVTAVQPTLVQTLIDYIDHLEKTNVDIQDEVDALNYKMNKLDID